MPPGEGSRIRVWAVPHHSCILHPLEATLGPYEEQSSCSMGTLHGSPIPLHNATAVPNCKTVLCYCEVGREWAEPNSSPSITMPLRQKSPNHIQWEVEAMLCWDTLPIFSVFLLKKQVGSSRQACAPAWQRLQQTISPADCCAFTSQMGKSLTNPQKFLPVDDFTKVWITPSCCK